MITREIVIRDTSCKYSYIVTEDCISYTEPNKETKTITFGSDEEARMIAEAILNCLDNKVD